MEYRPLLWEWEHTVNHPTRPAIRFSKDSFVSRATMNLEKYHWLRLWISAEHKAVSLEMQRGSAGWSIYSFVKPLDVTYLRFLVYYMASLWWCLRLFWEQWWSNEYLTQRNAPVWVWTHELSNSRLLPRKYSERCRGNRCRWPGATEGTGGVLSQ